MVNFLFKLNKKNDKQHCIKKKYNIKYLIGGYHAIRIFQRYINHIELYYYNYN